MVPKIYRYTAIGVLLLCIVFVSYSAEAPSITPVAQTSNLSSMALSSPTIFSHSSKSTVPAENIASSTTTSSTTSATIEITNSTNSTTTVKSKFTKGSGASAMPGENTMMRAFYVLMGVTVIIIIYFLVRACRGPRTKTNASRKYGLLSGGDRMEMRRLEDDDDEDDQNMLFDRTRR